MHGGAAAQLARMEAMLTTMGRLCAAPELRAITPNIARFRALDSEFDRLIAEASGNPYLMRAVEDGRTAMFLPIGKVFKRLADAANEHHEEIFAAVRTRDAGRAAEAMRLHIVTSRARLDALVQQQETPAG